MHQGIDCNQRESTFTPADSIPPLVSTASGTGAEQASADTPVVQEPTWQNISAMADTLGYLASHPGLSRHVRYNFGLAAAALRAAFVGALVEAEESGSLATLTGVYTEILNFGSPVIRPGTKSEQTIATVGGTEPSLPGTEVPAGLPQTGASNVNQEQGIGDKLIPDIPGSNDKIPTAARPRPDVPDAAPLLTQKGIWP